MPLFLKGQCDRTQVGPGNHEIQAGTMGGSAGACGVPYTQRFAMPAEHTGRRGTASHGP